MSLFEGYERRIDQINAALKSYGISSVEEAKAICDEMGIDVYNIVKGIQPICFENAWWAYIVGAAIAIKKDIKTQVKPLKSMVKAFRHSAFPVLLPMTEKLVSVTETSVQCFFAKKQSALLFSRDMNPLQRQRVQ